MHFTGSLAGGTEVTVTGSGFTDSNSTIFTICGKKCMIKGTPTGGRAVCVTPMTTGGSFYTYSMYNK